MDNAEYNDFLKAACDLTEKIVHGNIELTDNGDSGVEIDPECRLRLCIRDPHRLEQTETAL